MDYNYTAIILGSILIIALIFAIFMIIRGVVLWYFKVDTIIKNQERQVQLLSEIADHLKREKPSN